MPCLWQILPLLQKRSKKTLIIGLLLFGEKYSPKIEVLWVPFFQERDGSLKFASSEPVRKGRFTGFFPGKPPLFLEKSGSKNTSFGLLPGMEEESLFSPPFTQGRLFACFHRGSSPRLPRRFAGKYFVFSQQKLPRNDRLLAARNQNSSQSLKFFVSLSFRNGASETLFQLSTHNCQLITVPGYAGNNPPGSGNFLNPAFPFGCSCAILNMYM